MRPTDLAKRPRAAKVLGFSIRHFTMLEAEGVLVAAVRGVGGRGSLYDLAVIVPAYIAHVRAQAGQGGAGRTGDARARRDGSQAELNELKLRERQRQLLPRDQVVRDVQALTQATAAKVRALPRRMVQAGLIPVAAEPAAAALLREVLEEIAGWATPGDLLAVVQSNGGPHA